MNTDGTLFKDLNRNVELVDDKGLRMSAMKVFSEGIRFLREHLLGAVGSRGRTLDEREIHWVLTVPAIWEDGAKQFMREAAVNVSQQNGLTQ